MIELNKRGFSYVLEVKKENNQVDIRVDKLFKSSYRKNIYFKSRRKYASEKSVILRGMPFKTKIVAVYNKKNLADDAFAYYITNLLTWTASKVWGISRDRWSIEVQFRDLKQNFAFGKAAVRSQQAVETTISLSAILLTEIRLKQIGSNENQHERPRPVGVIVNLARTKSLNQLLSALTTKNSESCKQKLKHLCNPENLNKKPTGKINKPEVPVKKQA